MILLIVNYTRLNFKPIPTSELEYSRCKGQKLTSELKLIVYNFI